VGRAVVAGPAVVPGARGGLDLDARGKSLRELQADATLDEASTREEQVVRTRPAHALQAAVGPTGWPLPARETHGVDLAIGRVRAQPLDAGRELERQAPRSPLGQGPAGVDVDRVHPALAEARVQVQPRKRPEARVVREQLPAAGRVEALGHPQDGLLEVRAGPHPRAVGVDRREHAHERPARRARDLGGGDPVALVVADKGSAVRGEPHSVGRAQARGPDLVLGAIGGHAQDRAALVVVGVLPALGVQQPAFSIDLQVEVEGVEGGRDVRVREQPLDLVRLAVAVVIVETHDSVATGHEDLAVDHREPHGLVEPRDEARPDEPLEARVDPVDEPHVAPVGADRCAPVLEEVEGARAQPGVPGVGVREGEGVEGVAAVGGSQRAAGHQFLVPQAGTAPELVQG